MNIISKLISDIEASFDSFLDGLTDEDKEHLMEVDRQW